MNSLRNYTDLRKFYTYEGRFEYLMLRETKGTITFGGLRDLNQSFYSSFEWKSIRDFVVVRDNGMIMGIDGIPVVGPPIVHHMNPITPTIFKNDYDLVINPEYLITLDRHTHQLIHYARAVPQYKPVMVERTEGDTRLW